MSSSDSVATATESGSRLGLAVYFRDLEQSRDLRSHDRHMTRENSS